MEKQLVDKRFYEMYLTENQATNPIQVLGELYLSEQKREAPDVTAIRFAQGELYFLHKDYETAIFKWEKVKNELEPWAKRNIADAYFELGQFQKAEENYKAIQSDNVTLNIEIGLQLFSLYIEQGMLDDAFKVIKRTVSLNPDYPNITKLARAFYEEHGDSKSALDLAANEAIRTESVIWFDTLKTYVDGGYAKTISPEYFTNALGKLYQIDQTRFEKIVLSLWKNYQDQTNYLEWLQVFDNLFIQMDAHLYDSWQELSNLYQETYIDLIKGSHYVKELAEVIPPFLSNWLKIADTSQQLFASSAILAWGEVFPASISQNILHEAEELICKTSEYPDCIQDAFKLLEAIMDWAHTNGLQLGNRSKWWVQELADTRVHHLLIAGSMGSGKSSFINSMLGENILGSPTSTVISFKDGQDIEIKEITDKDIRSIPSFSDFEHASTVSRHFDKEESWIDFKLPCRFLHDHVLSIIDTPDLRGAHNDGKEIFRYLELADGLLFVLNPNEPLTEAELPLLLQIRDDAPNLPIHFILNQFEHDYDEANLLANAQLRISEYFQDASIRTFAPQMKGKEQINRLSRFFEEDIFGENFEEDRTSKLLLFIRKTIMNLLEKRMEVESGLVTSINRNEEMVVKLGGAIHQLEDLEKEKIKAITKAYRHAKDEIYRDLTTSIPKLLHECSELIKEDSDFRQIHHVLNDEMNVRIQNYIQDIALPKYYQSIQEWINLSQEEFKQSGMYLEELCQSFNDLYGEERIHLFCDFKVLEDWKRDADRMTSIIHMEKVNILHRFTPAQVLLKSASKLFGALSQNKTLLYNKYKRYLENEDFRDVAESITKNFLSRFELFENGLERDIKLFFRNPFNILQENIEEAKIKIAEDQEALLKMKENPEIYQDPLNIFEIRLRQYELINNVILKHSPYPYYDVRN